MEITLNTGQYYIILFSDCNSFPKRCPLNFPGDVLQAAASPDSEKYLINC